MLVRFQHGPFFMSPYQIFDHTADIGIKICADTAEGIFVDAASAMFDIITDTHRIKPYIQIEIKQEARDYDELLVQWLGELLYQYSVSGIVFKEFSVQELSSKAIRALCRGDQPADEIKTEIKAVTYHELEFRKTPEGYEAKVIFDV